MNLQHLKYALEVDKFRSINKAAENLYMGQPNLSRAIKELEQNLNITIFKRTSKGIVPTVQGEDFLTFAKKIIAEITEFENKYQEDKINKQSLSVSVPRAAYIGAAFAEFAKTLDTSNNIDVYYRETNAMRAIKNITEEDYHLGIVRYQKKFKPYFDVMFREKELKSRPICEFTYKIIMSEQNVLAEKDAIVVKDLSDYIEITHGDPYVPTLPVTDIRKTEFSEKINKRIYVFERASQFELLSEMDNAFMRMSPLPAKVLKKYGLVQKDCMDYDQEYTDVLIYGKKYVFSEMDKRFLEEIEKSVEMTKEQR